MMGMKGLLIAGFGFSIVAVGLAVGCTSRPTMLGPDAGLAYSTARDNQILNPDAGKNLEPVQGLADGKAAKSTMERYRASFENPGDYRSTVSVPSVVSQGIESSGGSGS